MRIIKSIKTEFKKERDKFSKFEKKIDKGIDKIVRHRPRLKKERATAVIKDNANHNKNRFFRRVD